MCRPDSRVSTAPHAYKFILLAFKFAIPLAIIAAGNDFRSWWRTALRFTASVFALWCFFILVRMIVVPVDLALATTLEQRQQVYDGDGAKDVAAFYFGWIPGIIVSTLRWFAVRCYLLVLHWLRKRKATE